VPIKVEASFQVLPSPNTLAQAGANQAWRNFPGAPINSTWFIDAIADKLRGANLETDPAEPDVIANFNSAPAAPWYFGLDARPPAGQVDFVSVVLHELGHGLGFLGSGRVSGGVGTWGLGTGFPFIYDRYVRAFGFSILSAGSSSPLLLQAYTSNNLFFQSPPTVSAVGPSIATPAKLFAPASFITGSSYSHLDETTYPAGDANALMTPAINTAEGNHNPGPITFAIFTDSGWGAVGGTPGAPTITSATGTPGGNVTVVWTQGAGAPPTSHLVQFFQGANPVPIATVPHGATTTFSIGPIPANIVGDFSVRVQGISGSIPGPFSPLFNFTIGSCTTPTAPIVSGGIVNGLGTVGWQAVAGATSYVLSAGTTAGGTQFLAPTNVGAATSVSAGGLPAGFQAFVRVVALNACSQPGPPTDFLLK
jgi:hypothetical protein